jgi:hypothetical protein
MTDLFDRLQALCQRGPSQEPDSNQKSCGIDRCAQGLIQPKFDQGIPNIQSLNLLVFLLPTVQIWLSRRVAREYPFDVLLP